MRTIFISVASVYALPDNPLLFHPTFKEEFQDNGGWDYIVRTLHEVCEVYEVGHKH